MWSTLGFLWTRRIRQVFSIIALFSLVFFSSFFSSSAIVKAEPYETLPEGTGCQLIVQETITVGGNRLIHASVKNMLPDEINGVKFFLQEITEPYAIFTLVMDNSAGFSVGPFSHGSALHLMSGSIPPAETVDFSFYVHALHVTSSTTEPDTFHLLSSQILNGDEALADCNSLFESSYININNDSGGDPPGGGDDSTTISQRDKELIALFSASLIGWFFIKQFRWTRRM